MRLDIALAREILLFIEEKADRPVAEIEQIEIRGWTANEIAYHVLLLEEARYIIAEIVETLDPDDPYLTVIDYTVNRLTINGHELLDAIRTPKHWIAIKDNAERLGVNSLKAIGRIAESYVTDLIKLSFGS